MPEKAGTEKREPPPAGQSGRGASWWRLSDRLYNWWYPPSHVPLNRLQVIRLGGERWWRNSVFRHGRGVFFDQLYDWWHPPAHAPLNRVQAVWFRFQKWWSGSALQRVGGDFAYWLNDWWYPPGEVGKDVLLGPRLSRPSCWLRQVRGWMGQTRLGRKADSLLSGSYDFAEAKLGPIFSQGRIWQWLFRWQTAVWLVLLLAGGGFACHQGRPWLKLHQERHYAQQAEALLARGDFKRALISARLTLSLNASNVVANHVMAGLAEGFGSPEALYWRQRELALAPAESNLLALLSTAIRVEPAPFPTAIRTLEVIPPALRQTAEYQREAGLLALKLGNLQEAGRDFAAALRLAPADPVNQVSLAVIQLQSTNVQTSQAARATLEQLATNPQTALAATRPLVADSFDRKQFDRAERLSLQVLANGQCAFRDRIFHLTILHARHSTNFPAFLADTQRRAQASYLQADMLADWMNASGFAQESLDWLDRLPPQLNRQGLLPVTRADAYVVLGKWPALEDYLKRGPWAGLEPIRFALLARADGKLSNGSADSLDWKNAIRLATSSPDALQKLATVTAAWGWSARSEDVLWLAVQKYPAQTWPLTELNQIYTAKRDTAGLRRVAQVTFDKNPEDGNAANNYATFSLLLDQDAAKAQEIAAGLYLAGPTNAYYASTYALSLLKQGRPKDALVVLNKLSPEQLQIPVIAVYHGIMLAAVGEGDAARPCLNLSSQAGLMPEELALVQRAQNGQ